MSTIECNAACMMAEQAVERMNRLPAGSAGVMVDGIIASLMFPPAAPYAIGLVVLQAMRGWKDSSLERSRSEMPLDWYPVVESTASADGRFFVGRLLAGGNPVTVSDAIRFVAIERAVKEHGTNSPSKASQHTPEEARQALAMYYEENRSLADKAAALAIDALGASGTALKSAVSALRHKIRVGF